MRRLLWSLIVCVLSCASSAGALRAGPRPDALPLRLPRPGIVVADGQLDSGRRFRVALDTGATHSAVSRAVVDALGLRPVARVRVVTPAGPVDRTVVQLPAVVLGGTRLVGLLASVIDPAEDDALGLGDLDGLLGQDALGQRAFTLDFETGRLTWLDEHLPLPDGERLPLADGPSGWRVALRQRGGAVLRLVPDSGADGLVLFAAAAGALPTVDTAQRRRLATLAGARDVHGVRVPALHVGAATLRDVPAVVVEGSGTVEAGHDGLLPLHLFARVTFAPAAGVLVIGS